MVMVAILQMTMMTIGKSPVIVSILMDDSYPHARFLLIVFCSMSIFFTVLLDVYIS